MAATVSEEAFSLFPLLGYRELSLGLGTSFFFFLLPNGLNPPALPQATGPFCCVFTVFGGVYPCATVIDF